MTYENGPVGRLLSRREVVLLLGGSAACLMAGSLIPRWAVAGIPGTLMRGSTGTNRRSVFRR